MAHIFHLDVDAHFKKILAAIDDYQIADIAVVRRDRRGHARKSARLIGDDDGNPPDRERLLVVLIPRHIEPALRHIGELFERMAIKDRKSTRLNSSHVKISYAVFCLKKNSTGRRSAPRL